MKATPLFPAALLALVLWACPPYYGYEYPDGTFPATPVNMENVNSEYDDINMTAPTLWANNLIVFASNRETQGGTFDLVCHPTSFIWDKTSGNLSVNDPEFDEFAYLDDFLAATRTPGNEYGPFTFYLNERIDGKYVDHQYFFYSSDTSGSQDVYFLKYTFDSTGTFTGQFQPSKLETPRPLNFLCNESYDEMYLTLKMSPISYDFHRKPGDDVCEQLVFCDNSEGNFNIYTIDIPDSVDLDVFLTTKELKIKVKPEKLNSEYNERCPYVCGDFMVFSSDRAEGMGGYDFYWSVYENGEWGEPRNFGAPVNSFSNEYRAIVDYALEFENQLMIFSSDRPGGKGGYDLYYVGFDKMPEIKYK
ncbi:MAG TPA: hypothetical protein PLK12_06740 [Prolixibacteraceae bacterium]|nr:hypothetical protein [Prolixibacteraceae bacterium]